MVIVFQVNRSTTSVAPFGKVVLHKLQIQVSSPLLKLNKSIPLYKEKGKLIHTYAMGRCVLDNHSGALGILYFALRRSNYLLECNRTQLISRVSIRTEHFSNYTLCNIERFFNRNHKCLSKSNALWFLSLVFSI